MTLAPKTFRWEVTDGVGTITAEGQELVVDVRAQGLGTVTGVIKAGATPQAGASGRAVPSRYARHATCCSALSHRVSVVIVTEPSVPGM